MTRPRSRAVAPLVACALAAVGCRDSKPAPPPSPSPSPAPSPVVVPDPDPPVAPSTALRTLDGQPVEFATLRRPATYVALWATWCKPCLHELPAIEALYRAHRDDPDVAILAVTIDAAAASGEVRATIASLGLTVPVYGDPDGRWRAGYLKPDHRDSVPFTLVLDGAGHQYQRMGLDEGVDLVATDSALIAEARAGTLTDQVPPDGTGIEVMIAASGASFPAPVITTDAAFAADVDSLVELLQKIHPELTAPQVTAARAAIVRAWKAGKDYRIEPRTP